MSSANSPKPRTPRKPLSWPPSSKHPLTPEQRAQGQRLVQQELAARGTLAQSTLQLHALDEEDDGEESL